MTAPPDPKAMEEVHLDCGDNGCLFKHDGPGGMRTNSSCRCRPEHIKRYYELALSRRDARIAKLRAALEFYARQRRDFGFFARHALREDGESVG